MEYDHLNVLFSRNFQNVLDALISYKRIVNSLFFYFSKPRVL